MFIPTRYSVLLDINHFKVSQFCIVCSSFTLLSTWYCFDWGCHVLTHVQIVYFIWALSMDVDRNSQTQTNRILGGLSVSLQVKAVPHLCSTNVKWCILLQFCPICLHFQLSILFYTVLIFFIIINIEVSEFLLSCNVLLWSSRSLTDIDILSEFVASLIRHPRGN